MPKAVSQIYLPVDTANAGVYRAVAYVSGLDNWFHQNDVRLMARASNTTTQSVNPSTFTEVQWPDLLYTCGGNDPYGPPTFAANRFTATKAGLWVLTATVQIGGAQASGGSKNLLRILVNGTTAYGENGYGPSTQSSTLNTHAVMQLAQGDYAAVQFWHDRSAAINIGSVANFLATFAMIGQL